MNFPETNLSKFHCDVLQQTQLGKLCGKNELFRDRYEILRMLGRGGFGVTFLAKDVYLPGQSLLLTRKAPFNLQCDTPAESLRDRATGEIYWQEQTEVSYSFGRIINKMVKISLEDRYQAAREILRELVITSNQEDLAEYLTLQPRMEDDSLDDDEVAQYLPPATRTAIAIREWKARKDAKQQHQNLNHQILSDDF